MATDESASGDSTVESPESDDSAFVRVADADELREEGRIVARADGRTIALFHHEGEFQAVDNRCPHMGFRWPTGPWTTAS
nr:Rieske 2Fe-2S domain-containing protein [Halorussus ruber]